MSAEAGIAVWCPPAHLQRLPRPALRRWQPLQAHTAPEPDCDAPDAGEPADPRDPRHVVRPSDPQPVDVPPVPGLRPLEQRQASKYH